MNKRENVIIDRDSGADCLRIILMIFIISHHAIVNGFGLSNLKYGNTLDSQFNDITYFLLNGICIIAVNSFFFISGYFGINRNKRKLVLLYLECVFYMVLWQVFAVCNKGQAFNYLYCLIPIKDYWFMAVYFAIAVLAPYINSMVAQLNNNNRWRLLLFGTLIIILYGFVFDLGEIGDGYSVIQGIYMYLFGNVVNCNLSDMHFKRPKWHICLIIYLLCSFVTGVGSYLLMLSSRVGWAWRFYAYNNPFIILGAVSFCLAFLGRKKFTISFIRKVLLELSSISLSVYLITDCYIIKKQLFTPLVDYCGRNHPLVNAVFVFIYALILYILCYIIEKTRRIIEIRFLALLRLSE